MNPKLTITVDAKNRALSVASGMITVGAKIDVEISGLPGDIPPWGASDAFSGPSARFRLVDECGRDLARYPLAEGDRWEPSGGVLSSLTPVEFDTDRLRCAFRGVAFDDTLPFGVIVDSAVDAAQYAVGRVKVRQWAAASTEDPTVLPDWRETLERLQKDIAEVSEKRDDAVAAKAAAESAASEAQSSRNEAAASASSALAAKNAAEAARDRAEAASGDFDGRLKDYAKKEEVKSDLASKADLVGGKVPANQLPSYVDDVLEYDARSAFPATGETGKIYVAKDTNLAYRWGGTQYVEISPSLALGETATTAYAGDKGRAQSDKIDAHVADKKSNPHAVTAAQTGAVPLVEDASGAKTAVTIGVRSGTVGDNSFGNGVEITASGESSHAEGVRTQATGNYSHAEGFATTSAGYCSHTEGRGCNASEAHSHAEGQSTTASGYCSHSEGNNTTAAGDYSHSEGFDATAAGSCSHAEGYKAQTKTEDDYAFAWNGDGTRAEPYVSHGKGTFNVNPVGGLDGFFVGEKKLSEVISDGVANKADKSALDALAAKVDNANAALEEVA